MSGEKDIFLKGQVARDFDFYRIREKVASLAVSEEGKFFLLSRESSSDIDKVSILRRYSLLF